jgi:hypothetical protein
MLPVLSSTAFENLHLRIANNLSNEWLNLDLLAERVGMSRVVSPEDKKPKPAPAKGSR